MVGKNISEILFMLFSSTSMIDSILKNDNYFVYDEDVEKLENCVEKINAVKIALLEVFKNYMES